MTTTSSIHALRAASAPARRPAPIARSGDRQARPAGPGRAGLARGRRARCLPGGRVRGTARSRHRARLGDRHIDRRDQRGADQRQPARGPVGSASNEFWRRVEQQSPGPACSTGWAWATCLSNLNTVTRGIPAFFTPNPLALGGTQGRGRRRGGVVLQHRAAARNAERPGRLRIPLRVPHAPHRGRGQRLQRPHALLRQPQGASRLSST